MVDKGHQLRNSYHQDAGLVFQGQNELQLAHSTVVFSEKSQIFSSSRPHLALLATWRLHRLISARRGPGAGSARR